MYNKYIQILSKNAKIDKNVTSLTARHSFATYLINKGLSMEVVAKMLGHTSTKQTKTYAALLDESILRANQGIKNSEIGNLSSKMIEARTAKISGQEWDDTLDWFRAELGIV